MDVNLAVEHAVRTAVEDALVNFVARAVWSDVLDARLIVDVLRTTGKVQNVERAGRGIAVERSVNVGARERATDGERERVELAVAFLARLDRSDVECVLALALELVVIEMRAFANHDLGDGVGEVRSIAQRDVALDHRRARVTSRHNEIAWMRDSFAVRDEDEVDRLLDDSFRRNLYDGAVGDESGVERGERLLVEPGDLAEILLDGGIRSIDGVGDAAGDDGAIKPRRQVFRERPVQK